MAVETSVKRSSLPVLIPLGAHAKNPHIKLTRPVYVIGSKSNCRIKLVSSTVSSTHALLVQTRHITYLRDLCSRTHIFVNGQQVKEAILHDGDLIALGRFTFKYQGPKKDHGSEPIVGPAALEVAGAPLPVPIEERVTVIGRRQSCDIPLLEQSVSTVHAVILQWEGKRFVRDLWSRCGTFVNGKQIHEQELNPGDLIRVGETDITFAPSTEEASFSVVEGASDSIAGGLPAAQEVDLGLEVEPKHSADEAPLELILTPKSPPKHDEMLPLDAEEAAVATPHDTAHIPLNLQAQQTPVSKVGEDIELEPLPMTSAEHEPAEHHAAAVEPSSEQLDLSRRGWRAPAAEEAPAASTEPEIVAPKFETLAPIAVDTDDAIAQRASRSHRGIGKSRAAGSCRCADRAARANFAARAGDHGIDRADAGIRDAGHRRGNWRARIGRFERVDRHDFRPKSGRIIWHNVRPDHRNAGATRASGRL